jgi:hypothetical protein
MSLKQLIERINNSRSHKSQFITIEDFLTFNKYYLFVILKYGTSQIGQKGCQISAIKVTQMIIKIST